MPSSPQANPGPASKSPPFRAERYELGDRGDARTSLRPIRQEDAAQIAQAMVTIDPWKRLDASKQALTSYLVSDDPHAHRRVIVHADALAGVVGVRSPWLYGPYLALLAIFPAYQGMGLGGAVMNWLEAEGRASGATNVWVCASSFNDTAIAFYRAHGFTKIATLDALIKPGFDEILLRKPLA